MGNLDFEQEIKERRMKRKRKLKQIQADYQKAQDFEEGKG
jgi:hypothetical protein